MSTFPERDWKKLRSLHPDLLDEACRRILAEVHERIDSTTADNHARYLALFDLLRKRDREIAEMFNDPKRGNAVRRLAAMRIHGLLSDELLERFSEETRTSVETLVSVKKRRA